MNVIKRYFWWIIFGGAIYFLLNYHVIFIGKTAKLMKKSTWTMDYTFFSTKGKRVETILDVEPLRKDGIGELLVEMGMITPEELVRLLAKYEK